MRLIYIGPRSFRVMCGSGGSGSCGGKQRHARSFARERDGRRDGSGDAYGLEKHARKPASCTPPASCSPKSNSGCLHPRYSATETARRSPTCHSLLTTSPADTRAFSATSARKSSRCRMRPVSYPPLRWSSPPSKILIQAPPTPPSSPSTKRTTLSAT